MLDKTPNRKTNAFSITNAVCKVTLAETSSNR